MQRASGENGCKTHNHTAVSKAIQKVNALKARLHTDFNPGQVSTLGAIAELKAELKVNPGYI